MMGAASTLQGATTKEKTNFQNPSKFKKKKA
jgi:hypothetical protein